MCMSKSFNSLNFFSKFSISKAQAKLHRGRRQNYRRCAVHGFQEQQTIQYKIQPMGPEEHKWKVGRSFVASWPERKDDHVRYNVLQRNLAFWIYSHWEWNVPQIWKWEIQSFNDEKYLQEVPLRTFERQPWWMVVNPLQLNWISADSFAKSNNWRWSNDFQHAIYRHYRHHENHHWEQRSVHTRQHHNAKIQNRFHYWS